MVTNGTFECVTNKKHSKKKANDMDKVIKINRNIGIKLLDFGMATIIKKGYECKCNKQPPQFAVNFKSPQIYDDVLYDAKKVSNYFFISENPPSLSVVG